MINSIPHRRRNISRFGIGKPEETHLTSPSAATPSFPTPANTLPPNPLAELSPTYSPTQLQSSLSQ